MSNILDLKQAEGIKDFSKKDANISDYASLLKPRVMYLAVFTAFAGICVAPGSINIFTGFASIFFTAIGAGAAGCLNMWYDRDIDSIMTRTKARALVRGIIDKDDALALGIGLTVISVISMIICVNLVSALILLVSILFYFFIYTMWLKRSTVQNIVIGGAAGAFPPLIGWSSVTGSITYDSLILFLIIFLWTPPHFWSLALIKSEDYKLANIPMMPVVYGVNHTKSQIILYSIMMFFSSIMPYFAGMSSIFYLISASFFGMYFVVLSIKLKQEEGIEYAPKLFKFSIIYLFSIFAFMIIDTLVDVVIKYRIKSFFLSYYTLSSFN